VSELNIDISKYEYPDLVPLEQDWRWCHKYAYDVVKGNIPSGKLIRQACERHLKDLERGELYFDEEVAASIVLWFNFIPITDGTKAGSPTVLLPWQIWVVVSLVAWKWNEDTFDEDGNPIRVKGERRFNQTFILVSRKAGKSTLAAGVMLYLMYKSNYQPRAFSLATKRDQAKILWKTATLMINLSPRLKQIFKVRANDILMPGKAGEFKALSSDSNSLDGLNPIVASLDECHAVKDRNLYGVIVSAFGAQPEYLMIVITTAGFILDGLCTDIYKNGCRVLDPDDSAMQDNYFYAMWQIDKGDDWTDPQAWYKANAGLIYGLPKMKYLQDRFVEASMSMEQKANFLTKHCNTFVSGSDRWLDMSEVKASPKPTGESYLDPVYHGRKAYVGLDRARVHDITSFCIMFPMDDGGVDCFYINLLPKQTVDTVSEYLKSKYNKALETGDLQLVYTPTVKDSDIEKIITKVNGDINPESWHYDPWHMRQICENMEDAGINMIAVSQGTGNMSEPAKNLEGLIKEGLFRFDSVLFEYACECAMMSMTKKNNMDIWRENDKVDKIDPLISTIITLSGATLFKVEANIYNEREMISI